MLHIHKRSRYKTVGQLNARERRGKESHQTLKLFFFTSKPRGAAACSIFEIISFAEHLDANLVSRLTSPW